MLRNAQGYTLPDRGYDTRGTARPNLSLSSIGQLIDNGQSAGCGHRLILTAPPAPTTDPLRRDGTAKIKAQP
jgi:hypothetical protein